jgi:hypothetical protein
VQCAVLADDTGLPLAGFGQQAGGEQLAAFASMLGALMDGAQALVPGRRALEVKLAEVRGLLGAGQRPAPDRGGRSARPPGGARRRGPAGANPFLGTGRAPAATSRGDRERNDFSGRAFVSESF